MKTHKDDTVLKCGIPSSKLRCLVRSRVSDICRLDLFNARSEKHRPFLSRALRWREGRGKFRSQKREPSILFDRRVHKEILIPQGQPKHPRFKTEGFNPLFGYWYFKSTKASASGPLGSSHKLTPGGNRKPRACRNKGWCHPAGGRENDPGFTEAVHLSESAATNSWHTIGQ